MEKTDPILREARDAFGDVRAAPGVVRTSIKCVIQSCFFRGRAAVIKKLDNDEPPWRWYFTREIAIHERLDAPYKPRMLAADAARGLMILERASGRPLAVRRQDAPQDRATWRRVIDLARAVRALDARVDLPPSERDRAVMRARLLEDPTGDWIRDGIFGCARRGLITDDAARALASAPLTPRFQHGDLLLRNVLRHEGDLMLVDWETAGAHGDGWDAGLLAVFAPEWARAELCAGIDEASFRACYAFALMREIVFRRNGRDPITEKLRARLVEVT